MLVNLSPRRHFRSEIEIHCKWLKRNGYTRDEVKGINFDYLFHPTKYTGVYFSNADDHTINAWCKQHAVYYKFFKEVRKMKALGLSSNEIMNAERNAWSFGVADNIEQILEYYNTCEWFKGNHVVFVNKIRKNHNGGWRWHKWGQYTGTREPQCEYLDDEPEIDEVLCYSIYKVI